MVGEKELNIHREQNSEDFAKPVNDKVFKIAKELGYGKQIVRSIRHNISDDHIPINEIARIRPSTLSTLTRTGTLSTILPTSARRPSRPSARPWLEVIYRER